MITDRTTITVARDDGIGPEIIDATLQSGVHDSERPHIRLEHREVQRGTKQLDGIDGARAYSLGQGE